MKLAEHPNVIRFYGVTKIEVDKKYVNKQKYLNIMSLDEKITHLFLNMRTEEH
jgi:hypothetical protein